MEQSRQSAVKWGYKLQFIIDDNIINIQLEKEYLNLKPFMTADCLLPTATFILPNSISSSNQHFILTDKSPGSKK